MMLLFTGRNECFKISSQMYGQVFGCLSFSLILDFIHSLSLLSYAFVYDCLSVSQKDNTKTTGQITTTDSGLLFLLS